MNRKPLALREPGDFTIGYCTNIHPGFDFPSILENLRGFAGPIQLDCRHDRPLGIGLWIPHQALETLVCSGEAMEALRDELTTQSLLPFTMNGFPYGNFHEQIVKHRVYEPTWWDERRRDYTWNLARVLDAILPSGHTGSISTLPLGWGSASSEEIERAAENLNAVAERLRDLEGISGRHITIAIEPEPGCCLDTSEDIVEFFDHYIPSTHRRYISVCHDICHSAVMNENQTQVLTRYFENGIVIGKVQVSSAIQVDWECMSVDRQKMALDQLAQFAEDRYLHQTGRVDSAGTFLLSEDLPELLSSLEAADTRSTQPEETSSNLVGNDSRWIIHFHVPIFLHQFGNLMATQEAIQECLQSLLTAPAELLVPHLEIETYAWGVLPEEMRSTGLVNSIASEIRWLDNQLSEISGLDPQS